MKQSISVEKLNDEIIEKIEEISGENIYKCYQCGKCSAGCPAMNEMDLGPAQAIRFLQLGLVDAVLNSKTIWICASCVMCFNRCPKGVDFSKIAEACRMIKLRKEDSLIEVNDFDEEYRKKAPQIAFISCFRKFTSLS
jgi:heterodisulfide reductase subunit C